jgi:hypothetical protein
MPALALPATALRTGTCWRRTPRRALPANFGVLEGVRVGLRIIPRLWRVCAGLGSIDLSVRILSRVVNSISVLVVLVVSLVVR